MEISTLSLEHVPVPTGSPSQVWIDALHASSRRLRERTEDLAEEQLSAPSMADGWSVAQVLSHLGSAGEICTALLRRGLDGDLTPPSSADTAPVWERWNALSGLEQRAAWQEADATHLAVLDGLSAAQRDTVRVPYFSGALSIEVYAGSRLSEQSVHTWDVEAALDPAAVIPDEELALLWKRIDLVASRFHDGSTLARLRPAQLAIELRDPDLRLVLELGEELHVRPGEPSAGAGTLSGPAEAVLRIVYGRSRPTDDVRTTGPVGIVDLRSLFPGY